MEDKNIRRDNQQGEQQENQINRGQQNNQQRNEAEDVNVSNPQEGTEWSNYRTRELSSNENNSSSETLNDEK
jgi:hypothetical protein